MAEIIQIKSEDWEARTGDAVATKDAEYAERDECSHQIDFTEWRDSPSRRNFWGVMHATLIKDILRHDARTKELVFVAGNVVGTGVTTAAVPEPEIETLFDKLISEW